MLAASTFALGLAGFQTVPVSQGRAAVRMQEAAAEAPEPVAAPPPPAPVAAAPAPPPAGKEVKPFEEKKSAVDLMPKMPELPEIPNPFGGLFGGDKKD